MPNNAERQHIGYLDFSRQWHRLFRVNKNPPTYCKKDMKFTGVFDNQGKIIFDPVMGQI